MQINDGMSDHAFKLPSRMTRYMLSHPAFVRLKKLALINLSNKIGQHSDVAL